LVGFQGDDDGSGRGERREHTQDEIEAAVHRVVPDWALVSRAICIPAREESTFPSHVSHGQYNTEDSPA